jgi:hypothetical protein
MCAYVEENTPLQEDFSSFIRVVYLLTLLSDLCMGYTNAQKVEF